MIAKKIKLGLFYVFWLVYYSIGIIIYFMGHGYEFFRISVQVYLFLLSLFNILHVFKFDRSNHTKSIDKQKNSVIPDVTNELIVGGMFLLLGIIYPLLITFESNIDIRNQYFFHIWDSLTIHILCWPIYTTIAQINNRKKGRESTYGEWKALYSTLYQKRNKNIHNLQRKFTHFLFPLCLSLAYFLVKVGFSFFEIENLSFLSLTQYLWLVVLLHLLWVMNIADLFRLNKFQHLGRFATRWFEHSLNLSEFSTYSSAAILIGSCLPFLLHSPGLFFLLASICTVSDAMASVIGKIFPIIRFQWNQKSLGGYFAGFITTFLLVFITNILFPFMIINPISLPLFALIISFSFILVDILVRVISDNFANALIPGLIAVFLLV